MFYIICADRKLPVSKSINCSWHNLRSDLNHQGYIRINFKEGIIRRTHHQYFEEECGKS